MQTFMPYSSFEEVAKCLDRQRLGKQRIEAWQIYRALTEENYGWKSHPIVKMWKGHEICLLEYGKTICNEWRMRGYKDRFYELFYIESLFKEDATEPLWIHDQELINSHRSNLLRKFPEHYSQFGWNVPNDLPYKWIR